MLPHALVLTCATLAITSHGATAQTNGNIDMSAFTMSLARTTGEVPVPGLNAPVEVTRDAIGVAGVKGETLLDVIRAQGFVHGQERFFQMDLLRRVSGGNLAALIGRYGVDSDKSFRTHRFQAVADGVVDRQSDDMRAMLEAYSEGVNAGVAALAAPPPEYAMIGAKPEPWRPRDSMLTLLTMFDMLQNSRSTERRVGLLREALPEEVARFLMPENTRFASPLLPDRAERSRNSVPPIPGPDVIDLRKQARLDLPGDLVEPDPPVLGSNNWAIAGSRSVHGGAILANDPHLEITVPGIWYRIQLDWGDGRAMGLSLPGSPGVLIGSNGRLAWGFTNTEGDFQDLIVVEADPENARLYLTPDGPEPFERSVEVIEVLGEKPIQKTYRTTRWGRVSAVDHRGRSLVLKWTALDPSTVNLAIVRMMLARTIEQGVELARRWYGPSQNVLLADDGGRIAWIVSGYFPKRVGFDGSVPTSWARDGVGWDGPMDESRRPVVIDPPDGLLYTANNRTVDLAWARTLGNDWDLGARARRIETLLRTDRKLDEADLRAIQLDTRVEVFDFYRDLMLEVGAAADDGNDPLIAEAQMIVAAWNGTADVDQPALRLLNAYRNNVYRAVTAPLVAPCLQLDPFFRYRWRRGEESVRRLIESRPAHLCPPGWTDWDAFLRDTLRTTLDELVARAPMRGLAAPWGTINVARVRHRMAEAAPALARMLNIPPAPLPGHIFSVRVATPTFGASARLVVSPGREAIGLLNIPSGQSGHPLSPNYRDSHPAWLDGSLTPLLAGETVESLRLVPGES